MHKERKNRMCENNSTKYTIFLHFCALVDGCFIFSYLYLILLRDNVKCYRNNQWIHNKTAVNKMFYFLCGLDEKQGFKRSDKRKCEQNHV